MANAIDLIAGDDDTMRVDEEWGTSTPAISLDDDFLFPHFETNASHGYHYPERISRLRNSMVDLTEDDPATTHAINQVTNKLMDRVRLSTSPLINDVWTANINNYIGLTVDAPGGTATLAPVPTDILPNDYHTELLERYRIPLRHPEARSIQKCYVNHNWYRVGESVELYPYQGHGSSHYFRIDIIIQKNHKYRFFGRHLCESYPPSPRGCEVYDVSPVASFFPKVRGELVWMFDEIEPVKPSQIVRHSKIWFLNSRAKRFGDHETQLVCRVRYSCQVEASVNTMSKVHLIRYLNADECDARRALTSKCLRDIWRGPEPTRPFGSGRPLRGSDFGLIDLTIPYYEKHERGYTLGDAYCGAGGVSCGARAAGFEPKWAVDIATHACETYRMNFDCIVENSPFDTFITNKPAELRVDVCHASPPCQPFSPAHTISNEVRDEQNSACIFTALNLLEKVKPRILTMEETAGLPSRHPEILSRMIMDMVELGYSVRWTVLDAIIYGVPQNRKRLLIIAAGPGDLVPEFPKATHGRLGLPRVPGVNDCIDNIPPNAADHDIEAELARCLLSYKEPYDGSQPAKTITCSGGQANHHPSGKRGFTLREFACLQTFPVDFQFGDRNVKRMIGNAVPPRLSEVIYTEIRKSLQATDALELQGAVL
ncbi:hypothetical protein N7495_007736 [Penicillium taxi]|uniref:uncharacterized protein n=1 Tax=Penicillium taxi TaxID=168475 RepID=UPI002544E12E|nr:uncharacterized protein N7495_007736 [Penicillium taxi]KAJ5887695.1 hypothetical protein N7495_007736 [Penicillium taxi]